MPAFNLLPKDLTPREGVVKVSNIIKKLATFGFIVLLISIIALVSGYFYIDSKIKTSLTTQENLKKEISALEQTEIRLVLVKDRLQKADDILSEVTVSPEVENLASLYNLLPEGVILTEASLKESSTTLTFSSSTSRNLAEFLANLISSGIYSQIQLKSLEFNQFTGYSVSLALAS